MATRIISAAVVLGLVIVGITLAQQGGEPMKQDDPVAPADSGKARRPTAEEVAKQWTYPKSKFTFTHKDGGPLRLSSMRVTVIESYDVTIREIDKFYSEKCGSTTNHAEPGEAMLFDKAESKEGGTSLISTLHLYQKDIIYLYADQEYAVTVLVRPDRGDDIEILLSVAVR